MMFTTAHFTSENSSPVSNANPEPDQLSIDESQTFQTESGALASKNRHLILAKSFSEDYLKQDRINGNENRKNNFKRRSLYASLCPENMLVSSSIYNEDDEHNILLTEADLLKNQYPSLVTLEEDFYFNNNQSCMTSPNGTMEMTDLDKRKFNFRPPTNFCEIDESPIDFKRNFAAIDRAAKLGPKLAAASISTDSSPPVQQREYFSDGDATAAHRVAKLENFRSAERTKLQQNGKPADILDSFIRSPDSHDSGIHVEYSSDHQLNFSQVAKSDESDSSGGEDEKLPAGWERHSDSSGSHYYWHVESGTVQRDKPTPLLDLRVNDAASNRVTDHSLSAEHGSRTTINERRFSKTTISKSRRDDDDDENEEISGGSKLKRNSDEGLSLPIRFAVRSLGWTEIDENDLKHDKSSRAVNKAIIDLSTGRKDIIDNVSKWGDGKELILELDDRNLTLIDPESGTTLHTQMIYQIRVWGVGRDNGRDFAYVARDRSSKRYMCHVFRCDTPARTIANTLRDICKRLMLERRPSSLFDLVGKAQNGHHHHGPPPVMMRRESNFSSDGHGGGFSREKQKSASTNFTESSHPHELPRSCSGGHAFSMTDDSFPTPVEEPKKVIRCHFLGITQVSKATGIDVLNEAVDRLLQQVKRERWILCDVSISPSTITIAETGNGQLAECRVRYLSFLGIGRDIKHCAFIMQSSMDNFMCYVFYVEPSAGALAKTIEAACKLRYQKVIDAHGEKQRRSSMAKGWTDTFREVLGNLSTKKLHRPFSLYPR